MVQGHERGVCTMAVVPGCESDEGKVGEGDIIITGSLDYTARTWDFTTEKMIKVQSKSLCFLSLYSFFIHSS